jgi:uncharacterized protein (UPF0335 family)
MPTTNFADGQLKSLVERIERIEEDKRELASDLRDMYAEAKGHGFDTKILRKVVALRRKDAVEREEEETLVGLYMSALGSTPLEQAIDKAKLKEAVDGLGKPVPVTEEEAAKGVFAAFDKDGARMSLAAGSRSN